MKTKLIALLGFGLAMMNVFAEPTVTDVKARQRYPWNGIVDIEFTVSGLDDGKVYGPVAVATNLDSMAALPVNSLRLWQDGTNTSVADITSNGTYRMIWNASSDVGELVVSNLQFCLDVRQVGILENGHKGIQLWENGPYWAECNIGAENVWDAGYYFWWGDTVGYKRENNQWVASDGSVTGFSFGNGSVTGFSFVGGKTPTYGQRNSTLQREGWITSDGNLAAEHDAAHVHWGGGWRMPTVAEIQSLISNTTTEWITTNGVTGRLVHGKGAFANRSIFLPAAGTGNVAFLILAGSYGDYWSSTPSSVNSGCAWNILFHSRHFGRGNCSRRYGQSVRPLRGFAK